MRVTIRERAVFLSRKEAGRLRALGRHALQVTQETHDAASKCLTRSNGDPDDRADKIQAFEGMAKAEVGL